MLDITSVDSSTLITSEGLIILKEEYQRLLSVDHPKILGQLKEALEEGLDEDNEVYQAANEERLTLERRIAELEEAIKNAAVVEVSKETTGIIAVGSKAIVEKESETHTFFIVGSLEADPLNGKISHESPLGQALLGRKVGDQAEFELPENGGVAVYKIVEVR